MPWFVACWQLVVTLESNVRGLDFPFLKDVFLLEVPRNPQDYVHLAGRVGRCGRTGTVYTLACAEGHSQSRLEFIYRQLNIFPEKFVPEAIEDEVDEDIWQDMSAEEVANKEAFEAKQAEKEAKKKKKRAEWEAKKEKQLEMEARNQRTKRVTLKNKMG